MGAGLLVISRMASRSIDLVALSILARLLSPADFGLVAIAMSFLMIVEAVLELPVGLALVTLPARTRAHFDTVFTLQLLRGALLALVLTGLAWPISKFYHDGRLIGLICVLCVAPASIGLVSPMMAEYTVNLDFRPRVVMEVIGKLVALAVSVGIAWRTGSYWSLVLGTIATPITMVAVSFLFAPYLPRLSLTKWGDFREYLRWTTVTQLLTAANWQMDQLLLGRLVSRSELGRFSMASNLSNMPQQIFVVQLLSPLTAGFSLVRDDARRLVAAYEKSVVSIVSVGLPVLVGTWLTADPLVRIILGDRWLEAATLLRWLSIAAIPPIFTGAVNPLVITFNRPRIFFNIAMGEFLLKLPLMVVGILYYGITGALVVRLITGAFVAGCSLLAVRSLIGESIGKQLLRPWRPMLSVVVMVLALRPLLGTLLDRSDHAQLILGLVSVSALGGAIYVGALFLLWFAAGRPDGPETKAVEFLSSLRRRALATSKEAG